MVDVNTEDILILALETSCDETSAAVVENGRRVRSNIISSQIDIHKKFGGVVPEIASRKHVELILPVVGQALEEASVTLDQIDVIATYGPGLAGLCWSAVSRQGAGCRKPWWASIYRGHIAANYLEHEKLEPPFICLVVSGGHSHIVYVADYNDFEIMGQTRDDAAGEAFDKTARALGLGYPGGPLIDVQAGTGNSFAVDFPRVYFSDGSLDFSFSGLKTAVLNYLNSNAQKGTEISIPDVCASFQQAVVDVLVHNTIRAAEQKGVKQIALAGGVAANSQLRSSMKKAAAEIGAEMFYPRPVFCTDNAAMIGAAAYYGYKAGKISGLDLNAIPGLKLGSACG